nr:hypothetical protein CFP56_08077 [Quercus suber]
MDMCGAATGPSRRTCKTIGPPSLRWPIEPETHEVRHHSARPPERKSRESANASVAAISAPCPGLTSDAFEPPASHSIARTNAASARRDSLSRPALTTSHAAEIVRLQVPRPSSCTPTCSGKQTSQPLTLSRPRGAPPDLLSPREQSRPPRRLLSDHESHRPVVVPETTTTARVRLEDRRSVRTEQSWGSSSRTTGRD